MKHTTTSDDTDSNSRNAAQGPKTNEPIPKLGHFQYALLAVLKRGEGSGKEIRRRLRTLGIRKSGPAYYQAMTRLEVSKFIEGWYVEEVINGQRVRERHYKILARGLFALNRSREFYERGWQIGILQPA
ncbi:MAG TPA: hypothetical protein VHC44_11220 [Verrucomicrobiae bacterium]|nr:hypothetical protein [Verrucomicrobiae bacterium]